MKRSERRTLALDFLAQKIRAMDLDQLETQVAFHALGRTGDRLLPSEVLDVAAQVRRERAALVRRIEPAIPGGALAEWESLADLLILAADIDVSPQTVASWSEVERAQASDWAAREHLTAADNRNCRRPIPQFLEPYLKSRNQS